MREHSVLDDLLTFRRAPGFLKNPRLYSTYPRLLCDFMERLYAIDGKPKEKIAMALLREATRNTSLAGAAVDLLRGALVM